MPPVTEADLAELAKDIEALGYMSPDKTSASTRSQAKESQRKQTEPEKCQSTTESLGKPTRSNSDIFS